MSQENRQQLSWRAVDVERLIGEDHPARAIWNLVGSLDLSAFYRTIGSSEEEGRRPAFDSPVTDVFVGVRLQPGDWIGAGSDATLRILSGVPEADGTG